MKEQFAKMINQEPLSQRILKHEEVLANRILDGYSKSTDALDRSIIELLESISFSVGSCIDTIHDDDEQEYKNDSLIESLLSIDEYVSHIRSKLGLPVTSFYKYSDSDG
jgi:hypothetical protein